MNMKFALAAGVCAASLVGFSDVTSANVVGYNTAATLSAGNNLISPGFNTVGKNGKFKLSDLKGTELEDATGDMYIGVLTSAGAGAKFTEDDVAKNPALAKYLGMPKKFYWYAGGFLEWEPGWYDGSGEEKFDADIIEFDAGTAFWSLGNGQEFQVAGQVGANDITIKTPNGGNMAVGNPFPINMKLSDMYGTEEEDATGDLYIGILTPSGAGAKFTEDDVAENPALSKYLGQNKKFYWYAGGFLEWPAGWYDGSGDNAFDAENIIFKPSQGMWVLGNGQSFVFPAPKLNN